MPSRRNFFGVKKWRRMPRTVEQFERLYSIRQFDYFCLLQRQRIGDQLDAMENRIMRSGQLTPDEINNGDCIFERRS